MGQSATASEPSRMASVSRLGEATEPGVEVVAADDDGGLDASRADQLVEDQAHLRPLAVAEPADPAGEALGPDPLAGQGDPAARGRGRRGRSRGPPRRWRRGRPGRRTGRPSGRAPCPRRRGAGCRRGRSRGSRRRSPPRPSPPRRGCCSRSRRRSTPRALRSSMAWTCSPMLRRASAMYALRVALAQREGRLVAHPVGDVAVEGVVGAGLVGDQVRHHASPHDLGQDVGGVAEEADRQRPALGHRLAGPVQGVVEVLGHDVEVAVLEPALDAVAVDLHRDHHPLVHGGGQRLGAAHPAEPGGQDQAPGEGAAEVLAGGLGEGLVGALEDPLGPDVDPASPRSSARTS